MSKPDDIPQKVWDDAYRVLVALMRGDLSAVQGKTANVDLEAISRALLAAKAEEREACALIADNHLVPYRRIASAIRARTP